MLPNIHNKMGLLKTKKVYVWVIFISLHKLITKQLFYSYQNYLCRFIPNLINLSALDFIIFTIVENPDPGIVIKNKICVCHKFHIFF